MSQAKLPEVVASGPESNVEIAHLTAPSVEQKRSAMTIEALADVDMGRLLSHEAIVAWIESLEPTNGDVGEGGGDAVE